MSLSLYREIKIEIPQSLPVTIGRFENGQPWLAVYVPAPDAWSGDLPIWSDWGGHLATRAAWRAAWGRARRAAAAAWRAA